MGCTLKKELKMKFYNETYNPQFGELTFEKLFTKFGRNCTDILSLLSSIDCKLFSGNLINTWIFI